LERLECIETLLRSHPGLFVAGNSYRGVSMNACIADAEPLARRVLDAWTRPSEAGPRAA
ncbi:MAG: protoporphyrinogen oxidase, partial [Acidobacteria bacterium]|nr:protoporphyrinogen oxidase [Acidobacteriota bacterium]